MRRQSNHAVTALIVVACLGCQRESPLVEAIRHVRSGASRSIELDLEVGDADLLRLADLTELEVLRLTHAPVSDIGLTSLAGLKQLRQLNLAETRLTDAAWPVVAAFPCLELLRLGAAGMTGQGTGQQSVQALRRLPALRHVHLMDVRLTNDGLRQFAGLGQLESLYLDGTLVTEEGIASLLESLPHLHIHLDETHPAGTSHHGDHRPGP